MAAVVPRKQLKARWNMDVHAPRAAREFTPNLPVKMVSQRERKGSVSEPRRAGTAGRGGGRVKGALGD